MLTDFCFGVSTETTIGGGLASNGIQLASASWFHLYKVGKNKLKPVAYFKSPLLTVAPMEAPVFFSARHHMCKCLCEFALPVNHRR